MEKTYLILILILTACLVLATINLYDNTKTIDETLKREVEKLERELKS